MICSDTDDVTNKLATKHYRLRLLGVSILYMVITYLSISLIKLVPEFIWWKIPVALLPVTVCILIVKIILDFVKAQDELYRDIQFRAVLSAFVISGFIFLSYGFLQNVGLPPFDIAFAFPVMILA